MPASKKGATQKKKTAHMGAKAAKPLKKGAQHKSAPAKKALPVKAAKAAKAPKVSKVKEKPSTLSSIKDALFGGKKKPAKPIKEVAKAPKAPKADAKIAKLATGKAVPTPKAAVVEKVKASEKPTKKAVVVAPVLPAAPLLRVQAKGKGKSALGFKTGKRSGADYASDESVCREVACEGLATTHGYCRLHYIKNWKKIKRKELILKEGKLNQYIEELVAKYPDRYIEAIRGDLASEKEFSKVIHDLDLDENAEDFDVEGESVDSLIDSIKRDFDDDGDGF